MNFKNGTYLAYLSSAEYANFGAVAPALGHFGFGTPADVLLWQKRAQNLKILQTQAQSGVASPAVLPLLATYKSTFNVDWAGDPDLAADITAPTVAEYQEKLLHSTHPGEPIQFLTGGNVNPGGSKFVQQSVQVLWAQHATQNLAVIVFRGTELDATVDILADLDIVQVHDAGITGTKVMVHRGFYNSYYDIASILMDKIKALPPGTILWITGHSLGGAVADLLTAHLIDMNVLHPGTVTIGGVYNFGTPRVGDTAFQQYLNQTHPAITALGDKFVKFPIIRVRNNNDLVTLVPNFNYAHAGTLLYFGKNPANPNGPIPDSRLQGIWANSLLGQIRNAVLTLDGFSGSVADHALADGYYPLMVREYENAVASGGIHADCSTDNGQTPEAYYPPGGGPPPAVAGSSAQSSAAANAGSDGGSPDTGGSLNLN